MYRCVYRLYRIVSGSSASWQQLPGLKFGALKIEPALLMEVVDMNDHQKSAFTGKIIQAVE